MAQVHIYGAQFSTFVRVVQLVCEEKQIDYTLGYEVDGAEIPFKSPSHLALHPFGKMPLLQHQGRWLAETAAICRYLENTFQPQSLTPSDPYDAAEMDQWIEFLTGYINHAIVRDYMLELVFPKGEDGKPRMDYLLAQKPAALNAIKILHQQLANKPFLLGDEITLADCMAAPSLYYATSLPEPLALFEPDSRLAKYCLRIQQRPSGSKVLIPK